MELSNKILKAANAIVTFIVAVGFLVAGAYAAYALWDNNTVFAAAGNVQIEMIRLKPVAETPAEIVASFDELLAVNEDVRAWVTMDNTHIDFPVVQGETNLSYINTDVYGNFALAGSIFLDTRSDGAFHDPYSLLYGHDMVEGKMFGDLALFKDPKFFNENKTGKLILPDRTYNLTVYASLVIPASDEWIFEPENVNGNLLEFIDYAQKNAMGIRTEMTSSLKQAAKDNKLQILSLSTCSAEFTDARTIILAVMEPSISAEEE